jgi:hypothetical protein
MRAAGIELKTEGVVRVMHPEKGMGVEFIQNTVEHRALLEKFLSLLNENRDLLPELLVEPEGLETEPAEKAEIPAKSDETEDALIGLFRKQSSLSADSFLAELRKQRGLAATAGVSA